jgi:hypothetical protein
MLVKDRARGDFRIGRIRMAKTRAIDLDDYRSKRTPEPPARVEPVHHFDAKPAHGVLAPRWLDDAWHSTRRRPSPSIDRESAVRDGRRHRGHQFSLRDRALVTSSPSDKLGNPNALCSSVHLDDVDIGSPSHVRPMYATMG